jgi:hypothetical protein
LLQEPDADNSRLASCPQETPEHASHPYTSSPVLLVKSDSCQVTVRLKVSGAAPQVGILEINYSAPWRLMRRAMALEVGERDQTQLECGTDCFATIGSPQFAKNVAQMGLDRRYSQS